jgi:hypothetical protein
MKRLSVVLVALAGATSCGYKQPVGEMCGNAGAASFSIPNSEIYIWERGAENPPPPGSSANISGVVVGGLKIQVQHKVMRISPVPRPLLLPGFSSPVFYVAVH